MNTSAPSNQASGSNKTLWAAVAVLGIAVLAMGATLIRIQSQPTEPRTAVLTEAAPTPGVPASAAVLSAPASAPASASLPASAPVTAQQAHKPLDAPKTQTTQPNKSLVHTTQAPTAAKSIAKEIFEPTANPKPVRPQNPETAVARPPEPAVVMCTHCGTVESVTSVEVEGTGGGAGAIAGGVLGAVVGNQIGDGTGKALATILGAVGGGMAGNAVEKKMKKVTHYDVTVRMDDGSHRTVRQTSPASVGSQVSVNGDTLQAR